MRVPNALLCLTACALSSVALADTPFDGTWMMNTSKSHLAGDTMTFEDAGGGSLKFTDSDQSYTFKPDGSSFTTPLGADRTFTKGADGNYTATSKRNGTLLSTATYKISADGNTIHVESKGTKPNGDTFDNKYTYVRTAPGTGIVGGWKSTKVELSSPNALTFQTDSANGVTVSLSAIKATCQAKWDGKDYPATGPTVGTGITLAFTKEGANGFKFVEKSKDKVLVIVHFRAAADGKTMNAKGTDGEGKEPFTEVYDKQS